MSAEKGETLNFEESARFRSGMCPDYFANELLAGPEGGFCQNVKCGNPNCGSMFNDMLMFGIERLTAAKAYSVAEHKTAYRS